MRLQAAAYAKHALLEIAWLLGSWAISFGLLGWLIGFNHLGARQLDIQLHNTYFVLPPWAVALPFFTLFATSFTSIRAARSRFQQRSTNLVLVGLYLLWVLLLTWAVWVLKPLK
ncbi:MAG: hypothetical protein ACRYG7_22215 [Janthinobacterium lividum]